MNAAKWVSPLFWIAAIYDGVLGATFLVAPNWAFKQFDVTPPNHVGYVQFPAALLLIFGLMFATVALRPQAHRNLIGYGILLKVAYCSVTGYHWLSAEIPWIWKPFVGIDLVMGALFIVAYLQLAGNGRDGTATQAHTRPA